MANTKISELSAAATLDGTETFPVVQSTATVKATPAQVRTLLSALPVNVETASYTLALSDAGGTVEMDVGSANDVTVPAEASVDFPVGTVIEVCQVGAGQTTIVEDTGVTVNTPETLVLTGQWSTVSLRKRAADEWVLAGDVEASA